MRPRSTLVGGVLLALGFSGGWIVSEWVAGSAGAPSVEERVAVASTPAIAVDAPARPYATNDPAGASAVASSAAVDCGTSAAPMKPAASGTLVARAAVPRSAGVDAPPDATESAAPVRIDVASSEPPPEELASRAAESPPTAAPLGEDQTESLESATRAQAPRDALQGSSGVDPGLLAHERTGAAQP
jgi:hypothetical protein